jgi:hypothetical protein
MIRHRETEQYYKGAGKWTSAMVDAMPFDSLSQAAHEAQRSGLAGPCEYLVVFGGQIGFRVLLPV